MVIGLCKLEDMTASSLLKVVSFERGSILAVLTNDRQEWDRHNEVLNVSIHNLNELLSH